MLGEMVYNSFINQEQTWIELNELANGCYQVVVQTESFSSTLKWIKQ